MTACDLGCCCRCSGSISSDKLCTWLKFSWFPQLRLQAAFVGVKTVTSYPVMRTNTSTEEDWP